ncbi:MAG TPA: hypothetical protein VK641_07380, partial [Terriglobales bacterium]|nr:hypothetical protein [Terriglobales bacterium]
MKLRVAGWLSMAVLFSVGMFAQPNQVSAQDAPSAKQALPEKRDSPPPKHKIGPFEVSINWRTRAEGWNWFQGSTGNSDYGLWNSLLRVGIGQTTE